MTLLRTVVMRPEDALPPHMISDAERTAYFPQSERTRDGRVAEYIVEDIENAPA